MTTSNEILLNEIFDNPDVRRAATVDICDKITKVLFFYFEEEQDDLDTEEGVDGFADFLWNVVSSAVASTGMRLIGKDESGRYIASFEPCISVKEFLMRTDIGRDDHVYFEDHVPDITEAAHFGLHDKSLIGE